MTLAEKIRELRAERGMSQEALAERLHVSRQAVTKWETGAGVPDVDNLLALADAFGLTLDELLGRTPGDPAAADEARLDTALDSWARDAPGTSRTEYDIDRPKHYDINLGGARRVLLRGIAGEKLRRSSRCRGRNDVASRFKVRVDDNRENTDVDVYRCNGATETEARENLEVEHGHSREPAAPRGALRRTPTTSWYATWERRPATPQASTVPACRRYRRSHRPRPPGPRTRGTARHRAGRPAAPGSARQRKRPCRDRL